jgi:hypothetical protein
MSNLYRVECYAIGEVARMATCATAADAILLAKAWHDEYGEATAAIDPDDNVIAEHSVGKPRHWDSNS